MTTILHVYSEKRPEDQVETLAAVESLRRKYEVVSRPTTADDNYSYSRILAEYWGKDDLVHFQQDVVPTAAMIQSLIDCPYEACTYPHALHTGFGLWAPGYTDGVLDKMTWYYPPFPSRVECSGMALCKFSKELQQLIPLGDEHWSMIDTRISCWMDQALHRMWHVHLPEVKHNHHWIK